MGVRKSRKLELGSQDLMTRLPSDLLMNILLRLPVGDIIRCKCVCEGFLELVMTPEFVKSHLSQSIPGLLYYDYQALDEKPYKILEFVENLDFNSDECDWGEVLNFNLPFDVPEPVHSSVNGLLFFQSINETIPSICNPITRECINLPYPEPRKTSSSLPFKQESTYGFGVSRISGQYKVVRMYMERKLNTPRWKHDLFECQVYTVGTGSWRRIASSSLLGYQKCYTGVALNGNLHWLAFDLERDALCISCFDLETELFTPSTPPFDDPIILESDLLVLENCLCLFNTKPDECTSEFVVHIWLMKEYGDHSSWTKEFVIRRVYYMFLQDGLRPIKILEGGDILLQCDPDLYYYSNRTKTFRNIDVLGLKCFKPTISAAIYTPSFVPLKTFAMENVISF